MRILLKAITFFLIFLSFSLSSHQRSESYSKWVVHEEDNSNVVNVIFSIKLSVLSKMEGYIYKGWENKISDYMVSSIEIHPECTRKSQPKILISQQNDFIKVSWTLFCELGSLTIINNAFFEEDPKHSHIAKIVLNEKAFPEKLFSYQSRIWKVDKADILRKNSESASFGDYISLGIKHISTGYDHLAFLLGILLLNQNLRRILLAVTGFTLGHSLTLSLGVFSFIKPVSVYIEALIGYSIILVGLEFIFRKTKQKASYLTSITFLWLLFLSLYLFISKGNYILGLLGLFLFTICYFNLIKTDYSHNLSLLITSLFGLIHGFGFGGYLSEVGLPSNRLISALFGFNLGVEIGQLFAVTIFILIGIMLSKLKPSTKKTMSPVLASALVSLGTFWFLDRIF